MVRALVQADVALAKVEKRQILIGKETAAAIAVVARAERREIADIVDAAFYFWLTNMRTGYEASISNDELHRIADLLVAKETKVTDPIQLPAHTHETPPVGKRKPRPSKKTAKKP